MAYNRRDLLVACLDAMAAQARFCDRVVVVDNASTDDSAEVARSAARLVPTWCRCRATPGVPAVSPPVWLAPWSAHSADLVWLLDDDTIPEPDALAALLRRAADVRLRGGRGWEPGGVVRRARTSDEHAASAARCWGRRLIASAAAAGAVPVRSSVIRLDARGCGVRAASTGCR